MPSIEIISAASPLGPALCTLGAVVLLVAALVHGRWRWPTIYRWPHDDAEATQSPAWRERVSVHLITYGAWSVVFGAVVWARIPRDGFSVRLPGEQSWPVLAWTEWIYLSGYCVPFLMPWLANTRASLKTFAQNLAWLLAASVSIFILFPVVTEPRLGTNNSLAGKILAWEMSRGDFGAASLPSFHVIWTMLCASLLSRRCRAAGAAGWLWAIAMSFACVANGAHAVLDVAASWALYPLVVGRASVVRFFARMRPSSSPRTPPSTTPKSP
jgi:hypothetical protein